MVSIREYYDKNGEQLPGKKGIALPVEQFVALIKVLPDVERVLRTMGVEGLGGDERDEGGDDEKGNEDEGEDGDGDGNGVVEDEDEEGEEVDDAEDEDIDDEEEDEENDADDDDEEQVKPKSKPNPKPKEPPTKNNSNKNKKNSTKDPPTRKRNFEETSEEDGY